LKALQRANYRCEIDEEHPSFIKKSDGTTYMEPHHLIPMSYQSQFPQSLDVQANIVSLCSNCHNQLHYGKDFEPLLKKLYNAREKQLAQAGIQVTWWELIKMYRI
jgi:5-methylcytosine-specific restriction protein A